MNKMSYVLVPVTYIAADINSHSPGCLSFLISPLLWSLCVPEKPVKPTPNGKQAILDIWPYNDLDPGVSSIAGSSDKFI